MRKSLLPLAMLCGATPSSWGGEYESARFGFRLEYPAGWTAREVEASDRSLHLVLDLDGSKPTVQLSVQVRPGGGDPVASRDEAVRAARARSEWSNVDALEVRLGGQRTPGLRGELRTESAVYAAQLAYVAANGLSYTLQSAAPRDEFERQRRAFDRVWAGFELRTPAPETAGLGRLESLAARCGSEIGWASSWKDAADRARRERKPVLVSARVYPGFQLSDDLMSGPYMDPDIVELVNERFVALRYTPGMDAPFVAPKVYGLSGTTFGTAVLLVAPDGKVLREHWVPTWDFLATAARELSPGPVPQRGTGRAEQARAHLRRGDLEAARQVLASATTPEELLVRADIARRARDGATALADLALARAADPATAGTDAIDLLEASVLLRVGRAGEAERLLVRLAGADGPLRPEALWRLGHVRRVIAGAEAAAAVWNELIDAAPESRWAWQAAATLTSTAWTMGVSGRVEWPTPEALAAFVLAPSEPLAPAKAARAAREALRWLLDRQLDEGSWASPRAVSRQPGLPPDDIALATSAICATALLPHREDPAVRTALARAIACIERDYASMRAGAPEIFFMDYGVWSRAALLTLFSGARTAGLMEEDRFAPLARVLIEEMGSKQRRGGGWSYYMKRDLGATASDEQSISFVTGAAVHALLDARAAGAEVPERMLKAALDCLERMRNADGSFEYMQAPEATAAARRGVDPGAAGRNPACAAALHRGGRGGSDLVRAALEVYAEHKSGLTRELGKALMHTGPSGQGSHYVLFDLAGVAGAIGQLPRADRARHRTILLEELLLARTADGGFLDNPLLGTACGTAFALIAFDRLGVQP